LIPKTEPAFRPLAALAFWASLFVAAGLFAVLSLAPKLRTYCKLSREYDGFEKRLASTERRTENLAKVADALEHDPQFASELARIDFDAPADEERIPVGPQLSVAAWDSEPASDVAGARTAPTGLLDGPFLETLSDDRSVRVPLMVASSLLVVVAFALCGDKKSHRYGGRPDELRRGIRRWLADRYRTPAAD
jgi:hypothetical protein